METFLLLATFILLFISSISLYRLFDRWRNSGCYLIDYMCYRPTDDRKITIGFCENLLKSKIKKGLGIEECRFLIRMVVSSGIGEHTYGPRNVIQGNEDCPTHEDSISEMDECFWGMLDALFRKTGIEPTEIDTLVLDVTMFCPAPSLSARIVNRYRGKNPIICCVNFFTDPLSSIDLLSPMDLEVVERFEHDIAIDRSVLVLFLRGECSKSLTLSIDCDILEIKEMLCSFWSDLTLNTIEISYSIESKRTIVETNTELQSILLLCSYKEEEYLVLDVCSKKSFKNMSYINSSNTFSASTSSQDCNLKELLRKDSKSEIIKGIGQTFSSADEFRDFLRAYSCKHGFTFRYIKNAPSRITVVCSRRDDLNCKFRIHASAVLNQLDHFVIKTMVGKHDCGAGVINVHNPQVSSKFVKSLVIDQIRDEPMKKPKDIINQFRREYNVKLSYYFAYSGKKLAIEDIHGDDKKSYNDLVWFLKAVKKTNTGSHVNFQVNVETNQFERCFVGFEACKSGFKHCRPMIYLDGTFLKGRPGCILAATAKNGNQGFYPLAMSIVSGEDKNNWSWFLEQLKIMLEEDRPLVFISDRHYGLLVGIPHIFPSSSHSTCVYHMRKNLEAKLGGHRKRNWLVKLFLSCAEASSIHEFGNLMKLLQDNGGNSVSDFLKDAPYERWADMFFPGKRYGELFSNVSESFNAWILQERFLQVTACLDAIRKKMMEMISRRKDDSRNWNTRLCPVMENRMTTLVQESGRLNASVSDDFIYEVQDGNYNHRVDLSSRTCTCNKWRITGFPCIHAIRSILIDRGNVYDYVEYYFTVDAFHATYSHSIKPIPNLDKEDAYDDEGMVFPPKDKRGVGRPNIKRKEAPGFHEKHQNKCGKCHMIGHNRKTCKNVISDFV